MRLIIDASVLAEVLIASPLGQRAEPELLACEGDLHLPDLAVLEVASILRGWVRSGQLPEELANQALTDLASFNARRWSADPLLGRIWELRHNATTYDAAYIALAEHLDGDLLTMDSRLARGLAGKTHCQIKLVP